MDNETLQALVCQISTESFNQPFLHQATFNQRLRTTGGRYHLQSHHIDINPRVYEMHGMIELVKVIKHELCHYHLHLAGRGYQHRDTEFKQLLAQTGGSRYVKPLQTTTRYLYTCEACQQTYPRQRKLNLSRYACGKCHGKLRQIK